MSFHLYAEKGKGKLPTFKLNQNLNDPKLYQPAKGLVDAVNVALNLGLPILLTGEPGTGKTQLAHHLAWFFGLEKPEIFNAQTTSVATDLFYRYDALGHFQYNQNSQKALSAEQIESNFIEYQGLGAAITSGKRKVVLIDEIDKAPRDLPNDILAALENLQFKVPEIGKQFSTIPENRPIIVMTSNSEKNLPDAFLRRVVYYHIPFPEPDKLLQILSSKIQDLTESELQAAISHFNLIRDRKQLGLKKPPATAELIYWTMTLQQAGFDFGQLKAIGDLPPERKELLVASYSVLMKTEEDVKAIKKSFML